MPQRSIIRSTAAASSSELESSLLLLWPYIHEINTLLDVATVKNESLNYIILAFVSPEFCAGVPKFDD